MKPLPFLLLLSFAAPLFGAESALRLEALMAEVATQHPEPRFYEAGIARRKRASAPRHGSQNPSCRSISDRDASAPPRGASPEKARRGPSPLRKPSSGQTTRAAQSGRQR